MSSPALRNQSSFHILRLALGIVYFHFGFIKFFPDLSPAELLATQTIIRLTAGWMDAHTALFILAIMECGLGLALIFNVWMKAAFLFFLFHMAGTFAPLFLLPELAFKISPLAPTLEGQYILKNIVFVAAGWAVFVPALFGKDQQKERVDERELSDRHPDPELGPGGPVVVEELHQTPVTNQQTVTT
jgi:uncharacterized membrane protein YkgB